jgi:hypothetical protein
MLNNLYVQVICNHLIEAFIFPCLIVLPKPPGGQESTRLEA